VTALSRTVPAAVPGIVFLSGNLAKPNLNQKHSVLVFPALAYFKFYLRVTGTILFIYHIVPVLGWAILR
jgi:hypothetical protein